jgi:hypothetical protein
MTERQGEELGIRPARRRMDDLLAALAQLSRDFMSEGCEVNTEGDCESP